MIACSNASKCAVHIIFTSIKIMLGILHAGIRSTRSSISTSAGTSRYSTYHHINRTHIQSQPNGTNSSSHRWCTQATTRTSHVLQSEQPLFASQFTCMPFSLQCGNKGHYANMVCMPINLPYIIKLIFQ